MVTKNLSDLQQAPGYGFMGDGSSLILDPLIINKFSLVIPGLSDVMFFMQTISLPSINLREVNISTPYVDMNEIGEKVIFEPFSITFLVDKLGKNWTSCFNWMKEISVAGSNVGKTENVVLMIDGKDFIRFYGAWPTSLSGMNLSALIEKPTYLTASLTLNYDYFEVINQFATEDSSYI